MYLTQSNFIGKTKHPVPDRVIQPENLPDHEKFYPNRWMEDRNLRSLHKKVSSLNLTDVKRRDMSMDHSGKSGQSHLLNVAPQNEKYMAIIYDYVQPEHAWKVLKWLNTISEENKKGLRLIKTIMEIRGQKKFKKEDKTDALDPSSAAYRTMQARDKFRRMTYQTSYAN